MSNKYRLIKIYPGSPSLNTICKYEGNPWSDSNEFTNPVLNPKYYPEFWELVVEKDYEILSLVHKEQNRILLAKDANIDIFLECKLDYNYWSIHSVKRLSDGEIFTIGDIIDTRVDNKYKQEILEINLGINDLLLKDKLIFKTKSGYVVSHIAVKVKQKLFTTEDGVDIFDYSKDHFYYVKKESFKLCENLKVTNPNVTFKYEPEKELYFSTKEKAEEYILLNKPCLSINDLKAWGDLAILELKKLVKTKLKND